VSWSQNEELEEVYRSNLVESLCAIVPLWIAHWWGAVPSVREARGRFCGLMVGHYGDAVLHKAKAHADHWDPPIDEGYKPTFRRGGPGTAGAFSRLAEGLAIAAYNPGGVEAFGVRWEAPGAHSYIGPGETGETAIRARSVAAYAHVDALLDDLALLAGGGS
jgi:hypothetical protein